MRPKSRELVERIRASRARPKLDRSHFEALADDVTSLGREEFLQAVEAILAPARSSPAKGPSHPLAEEFAAAQERTRFRKRRQFIDAVVSKAVEDRGASFALPARQRTMPRLLDAYGEHLSEQELKDLLWAVARKYAYSR